VQLGGVFEDIERLTVVRDGYCSLSLY